MSVKKYLIIPSVVLIVITVMSVFMITGCSETVYKVDYCGQKERYANAEDTYKPGTEVELYYKYIATDTSYSFYLDGERIDYDYDDYFGYIVTFTMPDHDVELECRTYSNYGESIMQ